MELKFWIYFFTIFMFASFVTTMKILYDGIKSTDEETCKKMLESIAKRMHDMINQYFILTKKQKE